MLAEAENHREKWERQVKKELFEMDLFMVLEQEVLDEFGEKSIANIPHKDIDNNFEDYSEANYLDDVMSASSESKNSLVDINESVSNIDLNSAHVESATDVDLECMNERNSLGDGGDALITADQDRYRESIRLANDLQVKNNILESENQLILEKLKSLETKLFQKELQTTAICQENENFKKLIKSYKKQIKASEILPTRKERLEIEMLNTQLKDQQEQSKAKESRLISTQERQRRKIVELETKNKELMGEISILERERAAMIQVSIKSNTEQPIKSKPSSAVYTKPLRGMKDLQIKSNIPPNSSLSRTISNSDISKGSKGTSLRLDNLKEISRHSSNECLLKSAPIATEEIPSKSMNTPFDHSNLDLDKLQAQLGLEDYISQHTSQDKSIHRTYPDSTVLIRLSDGSMKLQRQDINVIYYTNGDSKTVLEDGTVIFWYNNVRTRHSTLPDGTEICEFEDGQVERKYTDGTLTVQFPDDTIKLIEADGTEKIKYPNGNQQIIEPNGTVMNTFPDGREEIIINDVSTMKYQNGIIKISYPNGFQETRWPTGQVRLKDGTV